MLTWVDLAGDATADQVPQLPQEPMPMWTQSRRGGPELHRQSRTSLLPARLAVVFFFLADGTLLGNWFTRIPDVQHRLELSNGELGIALLGSAVGALIAMPTAGWLAGRLGSRPVTTLGAALQCLTLPLPALAPDLLTLTTALVILGAATGLIDVGMNVHGAGIERMYGRPIMSSFHAFYSLGGLFGALAGGFAANFGIRPEHHLALVAMVFLVLIPLAGQVLGPLETQPSPQGAAMVRPAGALARICLLAFCVVLAEGAIGDWSAVYLRSTLSTGALLAAAGYAAFSLTMTVGRLTGSLLIRTVGPGTVVGAGGILVAGGLATAAASTQPAMVILGFGATGLGLACAFPLAVTAAGQLAGISPAVAIATVNTAGYTGFLAGPPLIGFVSDFAGLRLALTILVLAGSVMVLSAKGLFGRSHADGPPRNARLATH